MAKDVDAALALAEEDPVIIESSNGKKLILMTHAYYRCFPTQEELEETRAWLKEKGIYDARI